MAKVTVLCALYKSGEYLESKLESIERLKRKEIAEFIFLNCGNHHDENKTITEYAKDRNNVRLINFKDKTPLYETWNYGIRHTDSEYICNYNADDQWHPLYLNNMADHLDSNKEDMIVTSGVIMCGTPNQLYPKWHNIVGKLPSVPYPKTSAGPSPMWRRSVHDKCGLFGNYRVIGDARLWEAMQRHGMKFGLLAKDLVLYYINSNSLERRHCDDTGESLREMDLAIPSADSAKTVGKEESHPEHHAGACGQ